MTIKIEARGLQALQRKMQTLFSGNAAHIISYLNLRVGRYVQGALQGKPYPPERSGQKYRRTGNLNRSWLARIKGRGVISVINSARYADDVVGDDQAFMHQGRWWQARDVAEEALPQAIEETGQYAESIWNG